MKKLKDKLIHMLGGLTEEDIRVRTRPVRVGIFQSEIETLRIGNSINPEMLQIYPEYIDKSKQDMANRLADEMIERKLVKFEIKQENQGMLVIHATARVCRPEV